MEATPRARVLVVDDERGPRESLRMILSPDHDVIPVSRGADALDTLRTEHIDLVTLDLNMPGMKGDDLMRIVRSEFPKTEIIVITGCGSVESAAEGVRNGICDYLQKPFDVVQVTASVTRALTRQRARARLSEFLADLGEVVGHEREAATIIEDLQENPKLRSELQQLFALRRDRPGQQHSDPPGGVRAIEFLEVLAETIETKDGFMRGHARRVAHFSTLLADRLCLSAEEHERVRISAFLHDLGKVGIPSELLLRASGFEPGERGTVERHTEIGARLVKPLAIAESIAAAIRHHHEWWDGGGYPDALSGEDIPLAARIIGIADAFDAMSRSRPYRPALTREVVVAEFERFAGTQFDPELTREFLALVASGACDVDCDSAPGAR